MGTDKRVSHFSIKITIWQLLKKTCLLCYFNLHLNKSLLAHWQHYLKEGADTPRKKVVGDHNLKISLSASLKLFPKKITLHFFPFKKIPSLTTIFTQTNN